MVPTKLRLKNFLCYKEALIELGGIRLACICGNNGAGKSALLDAITWALWGNSRSGIHHDSLVSLGQHQMEVELEFLCGRQRYRVIRKYARTTSGARHLLELQISDGGGFRSISGNTLKETQRKIEKEILHLDYQTFINSALLLQGRADEFTRKTPAERKEVLGKILGLEFYEELKGKASEYLKQSQTKQQQLSSELEHLSLEIAQIPQYQKELQQAKDELSKLEPKLSEQEKLLSELRLRQHQLESKEDQLKELEGRLNRLAQEMEHWLKEKQRLEGQLQENKELLDRSPQIEEGYRLFIETQACEEELSRKQERWHMLEQRKKGLEKVIQQAEGELEKEWGILNFQVSEIKKKLAELPLKGEKLRLTGEEISRLEQERASLLAVKEQVSARLQYLKGEESQKKRELKELEEKARLLSKEVVNCPLCGTELGPDKAEHLRQEFGKKRLEIAHQLSEIEREEGKLIQEYQECQKKEEGLNRGLSQKLGEKASLEKEIEEIRDKERVVAEVEGELSQIEARLKRQEFAPEAQGELRGVERELKELGYNFAAHQEVRRRLQELKGWQQEKERLEVARRLLPSIEEALRKACGQLEERRLSQQELEAQRLNVLGELSQLGWVREELRLVEERCHLLREQQIENERRLAVAQERLSRAQELKRDKELKEQELSQVEEEGKIYKELEEAFGKGGVQALLIEQALPVLEEEANRLVKKLTENRMSLGFRTQKSTREGKVVETLEIEIADELGTRNYEMYSGGEVFRIDFALRVALARLVTRRAGAPLPVLIIDEGFGSQDGQGRERLVEAIKAIADEFEMVLAITHMDELKGQFPALIEVTKTEQGSIARVIT